MAYGMVLNFPLYLFFDQEWTTFGTGWAGFCGLLVLFGWWKIESYELDENKLTRKNAGGLFTRIIDLSSIARYSKKSVNTNFYSNPLSIVGFFSNNKKYLIFRQITIITDSGATMKLDERLMSAEDFNTLYNTIKKATKGKQAVSSAAG